MEPFKIAVEGNIASGKSTLLEHLQRLGNAEIIEEPVSKWQNVLPEDGNFLERMYQDPHRWGYLFQSYVLLTMMEVHDQAQATDKELCFMERSIYSARHCFVENLRKSDPPIIDEMEYVVYQRWFDWLMEKHKPKVDLIVYLRTDPEVCYQRLKKRGRHEESAVPLNYLETLHSRYEEWLVDGDEEKRNGIPVLVLDANKDAESNNNEVFTNFTDAINEARELHTSSVKTKSPATKNDTSSGSPLTPESTRTGITPQRELFPQA